MHVVIAIILMSFHWPFAGIDVYICGQQYQMPFHSFDSSLAIGSTERP